MAFVVVLLILLYLLASVRILRQYERGVVFLLGRFAGVRGPGLTLIFIPILQMVRVSLRTVTMQIPSQKIITETTSRSTSRRSPTITLPTRKSP
jgi:regulator of protease activity HflC (stomatin/prohibitin superfamily)